MLNVEEKERLRTTVSMFPVLQSILYNDLDKDNGMYHYIYYVVDKEHLFMQYPATKNGNLLNWERTEDHCKYFESGKMDYYDAR